ncbi:NmrA/HSCARG family protein [uncultured Sphingomonas sp.]|uniref:NmrA/HSCARG family protein n=1 Tax=uncultured Sphingomonas sp. TaxID=158754 RepID=UPI0035C9B034
MADDKKTVLVFGATGQQGGSVAAALLAAGWPVRAFVRDPAGAKAKLLAQAGAEVVEGDLADDAAIRAAMADAYGVFSAQPSSGQGAVHNVTDEEEVRYGVTIADHAAEAGVRHLVYSSSNAARDEPSGMGHFDSKARIERHVRTLPITITIIRPAAFMEMLMMPGFGLPEGHFTFFMQPDQKVQVLAVEDIGKIVAAIFADPNRFAGETLEIASDTVTGNGLAETFTQAAGKPISYLRFPDDVLAGNPFLAGLTRLVDDGRLAGHADLALLRTLAPGLLTFHSWLAGAGRPAFHAALGTDGVWSYDK